MTALAAPVRLDASADAPMSRAQLRGVALTVALSALDGYDVLSVTFAAPAISQDWAIGRLALGAVLSSGLAGMALGSFLLAPVADLVGRKAMVLVSLLLMAAGSFGSATAADVAQLSAWRVCTGLGIGTCVAVIAPLAAEFSNARWRSFASAAKAMGYPAGGLVGGLLAAALLHWSGWPAVFVAGGVAGAVMIVLTAALLPESPAFLARRGGAREARRGYAGAFASGRAGSTLRLATVNALAAAVVYYILSWLPQMVGDAGLSPSQASIVSATLSLFGIAGGLTLGALARRRPEPITAAAIVALAAALAAFGLVPASMAALTVAAGVLGFLVFASSAGMYAALAGAFDDASRAAGSGFVIGVGRVSSAVAPLAAGWLFATGLDRGAVSAAFAGCALAAGLLLATYRSKGPVR